MSKWHNTTSKDKRERIALRSARWRMLELLKTKHVLSTMFNFEYSLEDHNFERNLEKQLKNERNPWRTTMLSPRRTPVKRIKSSRRNKNKSFVMLILYQLKSMTNKGFGMPLILLQKIKRDIVQTWEGLEQTTGRIWKERMTWHETKEEESWANHRQNWKWTKKREQIIGKN